MAAPNMGTPASYREVQRFRQWFFYVPVLVVAGVIWWQFVEQIVLGNPQGAEPIPNWLAWVLTLVFGIGLPVLMASIRLITEVRPGEVSVRLAPFSSRTIDVLDIREAAVREYSAIREFGGWGVRISRDGRAYNAYGNRGVQLILRDGNRILIGSQKPDVLLAALRSAGARV